MSSPSNTAVDLWISASPKWLMAEIHRICFLPAFVIFFYSSFNRSGLLYLTSDEGNGDENDDNDDLNVRKCNPLKSGANGIFRKSWETFEIHIFLSKCYIVWLTCCNSCVHSMHSMIHTILLQVEICWNSRFDFLWLSKIASLHIEKATPLIHVIHVA